jgi:hypothetical protein
MLPNNRGVPNHATVFFLRQNDRLFLVTAKHVLSGCIDTTKNKNVPSILYISVLDSSNGEKLIKIDVSIIKDTASCLPLWEDADIICVEMTGQSKLDLISVNSCEGLKSEKLYNPSHLTFYGFPGRVTVRENNTIIYPGVSKFDLPIDTNIATTTINKFFIDSINYWVNLNKVYEERYFAGYSGSPVFIKNRKSGKWNLIGVLVSDASPQVRKHQSIQICKIKYALAQIE